MMRLELLAGPVIVLLVTAVALTLTPVWIHPGSYFGVRVPPEYRDTAQARRTGRKFAIAVWLATALALALVLTSTGTGMHALIPGAVFLQIGAAMIAFQRAWRETKPHAVPPSSTRTAYLLSAAPRVPGGAFAVVMPFVILVAVSFYLLAHWSSIPARFPVHWDFNGHPNGWSTRSFLGVFGPVLNALLILAWILGLGVFMRNKARRAPDGSGLDRRNRAVLGIMLLVMWIISLGFSLAALTPLILRNGQFPIPAFVFVLVPIVLVIGSIWWVVRANAGPDDTPADNTPDECWKWGMFYYNPGDSSILVEKRFGIGQTFNFARWQSWALLAAVLGVILASFLIARAH